PIGNRGKAAKLHQQRTVALERNNMAARLCNGDTKRNWYGETHAAKHVEILRTLAARPQVKVGVTDSANDRFVALELSHEPLGQFEAVHHLGIVRPDGSGWLRGHCRSPFEDFAAGEQRREDKGDGSLRRHGLLDGAIDGERKLVLTRYGDVFD